MYLYYRWEWSSSSSFDSDGIDDILVKSVRSSHKKVCGNCVCVVHEKRVHPMISWRKRPQTLG